MTWRGRRLKVSISDSASVRMRRAISSGSGMSGWVAIHDPSAEPVAKASTGAALRAGGILRAEVGRNLFQQSVQFGALGGVQCADRALFQRFPGGFDLGAKSAAAFRCRDENSASVGGVGGPGDLAR